MDLVYSAEPQTVVDLVGDVTRLRQVIVNLLGNGIKFTDRGEIEVTLRTRDQDETGRVRLLMDVRDTGIGIPADRLGALSPRSGSAAARPAWISSSPSQSGEASWRRSSTR